MPHTRDANDAAASLNQINNQGFATHGHDNIDTTTADNEVTGNKRKTRDCAHKLVRTECE